MAAAVIRAKMARGGNLSGKLPELCSGGPPDGIGLVPRVQKWEQLTTLQTLRAVRLRNSTVPPGVLSEATVSAGHGS
jgi:hypothetical protein